MKEKGGSNCWGSTKRRKVDSFSVEAFDFASGIARYVLAQSSVFGRPYIRRSHLNWETTIWTDIHSNNCSRIFLEYMVEERQYCF